MTNIIIDPLLEYTKKLCHEDINLLKKQYDKNENDNIKKKLFESMITLNEIIKNINNKVLSKDINKFLAPHLYFDKNNVLVIKNESKLNCIEFGEI